MSRLFSQKGRLIGCPMSLLISNAALYLNLPEKVAWTSLPFSSLKSAVPPAIAMGNGKSPMVSHHFLTIAAGVVFISCNFATFPAPTLRLPIVGKASLVTTTLN